MASRLSAIDGLKILASQTIVLHHLSSYGPLAEAAHRFFPFLFDWLFGYGRMAVQVFLVAGGFLAAQSLAPDGVLTGKPAGLIARRYVRLIIPLMIAIAMAVVCAGVARGVMVDESIPSTPKVRQVLAHVFLLQDVLQIPALSAGVWYVAIDFQLYSLTVLLLFVAGRLGRTDCWARFLGALFVSGAAVLSLFVFNCDPAWDFIAIYHFAAYAMGLVCYWLIKDQRLPYFWLGVAVLVAVAGLGIHYRDRLMLALLVASIVGVGARAERLRAFFSPKWVQRLSRESYSLYLVHFPVCLLVNALFVRFFVGAGIGGVLVSLGLAFVGSLCLASYFCQAVDASSVLIVQRLGLLVRKGVVEKRRLRGPQARISLPVWHLPSSWVFRKS